MPRQDMTNITHFIDFHEKRTLMTESYFELIQICSLPPTLVKVLQVCALVLTGWLACVGLAMLMMPYIPLTPRKPNKDIFFAACQEKIRKSFHHQTEETFQTIEMGSNRVLRTNTEDPTVFMVLVPQGAMPTAYRLVALLIHCILLANQLPASEHHILRVTSNGANFTSPDHEWPLFHQIKNQLRLYGVAAVLSFECVHPHVVRSLQLLVPQVHAPSPESVLILVVDLKNRLTEYQKKNSTPNSIGRTFLQEYFGPYFYQLELQEIIKRFGCRCMLINAEQNI
ncbi:uncharacterized protein LOC129001556 isoform X1 [Macrosteles quadrilineatus]|uniref:uncharacterized protein LOC129001556 isoform X1 n=1 Tax=Macrosteles quadrilineatus TaxID=74068 RepID=UPI0023E1298A|nr:uncharacterized protein LOC129001556 isoform X1 [Macrosteles quadrilineatus]